MKKESISNESTEKFRDGAADKSGDVREFMKENRLIKFNENNESLKVKRNEKKPINPFFPVKWIAALYFIGSIGVLLEYVLMSSKGYVYIFLTTNALMNSELSTIGTILRAPFVMLLLILPFIVPGMIIFFIIKYVSDKFNLFSKNERIAFLTLLGSMLSLMTILSYL